MKSRWLMQNSDGSLWRTMGLYTHAEVKEFLCAKPVRRIGRWEWLTDWLRDLRTSISKTWRRVARAWN